MLRRIHHLLPGAGLILLVIIGSDDKNMSKSCWGVGRYALGCRTAIGLMCWHQCFFWCDIILDSWLPWYGSWSRKLHNSFIGSR